MAWILYFISVAFVSIGACSILYTTETHKIIAALLAKINRKVICALPFGVGLLLLVSASSSSFPWLIRLFGLIGLLKGAFAFFNPKGLYDRISQWYLESISEQGDRLFGILAVILGTALLSWIK